jgi:signal transduction histidine kinase
METFNFTQKLINSGVTPDLKIEEAQVVRLTNLFGMIPMIFYIIYILNGILYDIPFFWQIGLINMLLNFLSIFLNNQRRYPLAKTILLSSNSFILLLFINMVDGNASAIAFFFPVLTCYVVFYDIMKELNTVLINLSVTAVCILLSLLLPAHSFGQVALPEYMAGSISKMNFILAFTAFTFYIFTIIKIKLQTETLLLQSIETAEIMADKSDQMVKQLSIQKTNAEHHANSKNLFIAHISAELQQPVDRLGGITSTVNRDNQLPESEWMQLRSASLELKQVVKNLGFYNLVEANKLKPSKNIFNIHHCCKRVSESVRELQMQEIKINIANDEILNSDFIGDDNLLHDIIVCTLTGLVDLNPGFSPQVDIAVIQVRNGLISTGIYISDVNAAKPPMAELYRECIEKAAGAAKATLPLSMIVSEKLVNVLGGKADTQINKGKPVDFFFCVPMKTVTKLG